jgi:hypothetical protein
MGKKVELSLVKGMRPFSSLKRHITLNEEILFPADFQLHTQRAKHTAKKLDIQYSFAHSGETSVQIFKIKTIFVSYSRTGPWYHAKMKS